MSACRCWKPCSPFCGPRTWAPRPLSATSRRSRSRRALIDLIYETADGYMTVAALTDRQWAGLARVVGRPEWIDDERFRTPALRQKNIDERLEVTQAALMARPAAEWLDLLTAAGVPCGPVLTRNQVIRHPQVRGARPRRRDRSSAGGPAAPDPAGRTFFSHPAGDPPRRPGLRRAHRGGVGRDWLFGSRHRAASSGEHPMIDFYYWPTPNGWKVAIMLEECGLEYRMIPVNIGARRPVQARVSGDQPQQPDAGDCRS